MDVVPDASTIDVWPFWLKAPASLNREYRSLLSSNEVERADRFALEHLTRAHELSHGALRLLLAGALSCKPQAIEYRYGPRGKPFLGGPSRLQFNMAHSGNLALYAFTLDQEIGVDLEEIRGVPEIYQIAARYFCEEEAAELKTFPTGTQANQAFFRCWTRKEAYIKAVGDGLSIPLNRFQVSLSDETAQFLHIDEDKTTAAQWTLQHLDPVPNYFGALAYHNAPRTLRLHSPLTPEQLLDFTG